MSDFIFTILSTAVNEETHEIACQTKCIGELVRCKDCKFNYGIANNCEFSKSDIVCTLWESDGLDENDYCSRGIRRKQDE